MTTFEYGHSPSAFKFVAKNSEYCKLIEEILALSNRSFGREAHFDSLAEKVCFDLGQSCREDFLQLLFLVANGYPNGALQILRSFYERAANLEYIRRNPQLAERFVAFGEVQSRKLMQATLKVAEIGKIKNPLDPRLILETEAAYDSVKNQFTIFDSRKNKFVKHERYWIENFPTIVGHLGGAYARFFASAYISPSGRVHATLESIASLNKHDRLNKVRLALDTAFYILMLVIRAQDLIFGQGLSQDLKRILRAKGTLYKRKILLTI